MSKATPGPWIYRKAVEDDLHSHWIDGPSNQPGGGTRPLAEVRTYYNGESEANARLIAAAPDLLAAVQSLVFLVKESGFRSGLTEDAFDAALLSGIAAIEKARGTA